MAVHLLLLMVAVIVLIVLGAIVAIASLLSSEKGRTALKVLLIVPALAIVVGLLALVGHRTRIERQARLAERVRLEQRLEAQKAKEALLREHTDETSDRVATDAVAAAESDEAEAEPAPAVHRPDWVEAEPRKVGGAYQMAIAVGPYSTRLECDRELPEELNRAIDEYVSVYIGPRACGHVRLPLQYIQDEIVKENWLEQKQVVISPKGQIPEKRVAMAQLHVLLEFDHAVNARIQEAWNTVVVRERLYGVGALTATLLVLLSTVYGYLRIDLATGGAYRGRLRLAAAAVILIAIVAGLVLSAV